MIPQVRYLCIGFLLLTVSYVGRRVYLYHCDTTSPVVMLQGFENNKAYAGDVVGLLKGSSAYKIAHVSMWLDDNPVHRDFKINRKNFEHPISIPVKSVSDGMHILKLEVVDGTKHQNKTMLERIFYTDNLDLQATQIALSSSSKVAQGNCLYLQIQVNKPIYSASAYMFNTMYALFPENKNSLIYETYVPMECDQEPGEYPVRIEVIDRLGNKITLENKFEVTPVAFKKRILNIQGNKLQSELEHTSLQEQDLEMRMEQLAKDSGTEKLWCGIFDVPIVMKGITTDFGVIRTSQERGRRVHKALDLVADPKSVIWATNHGIVVLKDRFTHTGNTVVIDHGCGILSLYCHMLDFADNLVVGQKVKKGHPLGRMGMTGYASGDHLHWEIRVRNVPVHPMQWTTRWY